MAPMPFAAPTSDSVPSGASTAAPAVGFTRHRRDDARRGQPRARTARREVSRPVSRVCLVQGYSRHLVAASPASAMTLDGALMAHPKRLVGRET
jgi:hypothetical protein